MPRIAGATGFFHFPFRNCSMLAIVSDVRRISIPGKDRVEMAEKSKKTPKKMPRQMDRQQQQQRQDQNQNQGMNRPGADGQRMPNQRQSDDDRRDADQRRMGQN
ncbi:hypothetical protein DMB37_13405 [Nocardia sp. CS682]|nr:hypothetical protein DMB37_13405 [Nocardia sp. CS682]